MQYKIGTVDVTNGSSVVTGNGTAFLANVNVGDLFKRSGENAIYQVTAKDSDTQIQISPVYAGTTGTAVQYQISRDRTPNLGLAEINPGDEDWPYWLTNEVIRKLDTPTFLGLLDVYVGSTEPTDPTKMLWVKTP